MGILAYSLHFGQSTGRSGPALHSPMSSISESVQSGMMPEQLFVLCELHITMANTKWSVKCQHFLTTQLN